MEQMRPPVVTILGHVDHGKTTLLDYIRKTSVAAKEHGGITQSIGAYQSEFDGKQVTFIDTPGHAAFEKMRSRGAKVADIAVLVVAVDDGIMPQTIEAIKHIKLAEVPMIVAINKVDLPGVNVKVQLEKIKKQLSDNEVLVEEYGGDVPLVQLSAKTGDGVIILLENIIMLAEMHELKSDPDARTQVVVIESHLDKFKGAIAAVLVRDGTLRKNDQITVGGISCKVRGMFDWAGKTVETAGPSVPVEVLGWKEVPMVGASTEESALKKEKSEVKSLIQRLKDEASDVLNIIVHADTTGSLEAIEENLNKMNQDGEHIKIISSSTGDITDSDVELAVGTKSIVIGFGVGIKTSATKIAQSQHILIRTYTIIYELLDELKDVVDGMLKVGVVEEVFGRAQIIAEFPYGKDTRIAGCKILEGTFSKGPKIRLVRDEAVILEGKIASLKLVRVEVQKVEKGQECGMMFTDNLEFAIGDLVESFRTI